MENSAEQYIGASTRRRIARKSRQVTKVEHKRQADSEESDIDDDSDDAGPGRDAKGKGNEAKGKGKAGTATTGPPGNPPAQPPGPPPGLAPAQPQGPSAVPALAPPPSPPAASIQPPPPPPSPSPPPTTQQLPPPATTVEPPPPPGSSSPPPPPPNSSGSAPPPPPPALPVSTTTSLVISTTLAVDSTSIKPLPSVLEPSFYDTTVSNLITSSPTSTSPPQTPTFGPSAPTDSTGNTRQTVQSDAVISPTAKHLLLALGVMGAVSLFITASIILMRRSRRKIIYRVDGRSPSPEVPFQGRDETFHGVTTEITAAPRTLSFHQRSRSEMRLVAQPRFSTMKQGEAMDGAMSVPNNSSLPQPSEGRTFSDALNSFMEKARNSSYSYKVGP